MTSKSNESEVQQKRNEPNFLYHLEKNKYVLHHIFIKGVLRLLKQDELKKEKIDFLPQKSSSENMKKEEIQTVYNNYKNFFQNGYSEKFNLSEENEKKKLLLQWHKKEENKKLCSFFIKNKEFFCNACLLYLRKKLKLKDFQEEELNKKCNDFWAKNKPKMIKILQRIDELFKSLKNIHSLLKELKEKKPKKNKISSHKGDEEIKDETDESKNKFILCSKDMHDQIEQCIIRINFHLKNFEIPCLKLLKYPIPDDYSLQNFMVEFLNFQDIFEVLVKEFKSLSRKKEKIKEEKEVLENKTTKFEEEINKTLKQKNEEIEKISKELESKTKEIIALEEKNKESLTKIENLEVQNKKLMDGNATIMNNYLEVQRERDSIKETMGQKYENLSKTRDVEIQNLNQIIVNLQKIKKDSEEIMENHKKGQEDAINIMKEIFLLIQSQNLLPENQNNKYDVNITINKSLEILKKYLTSCFNLNSQNLKKMENDITKLKDKEDKYIERIRGISSDYEKLKAEKIDNDKKIIQLNNETENKSNMIKQLTSEKEKEIKELTKEINKKSQEKDSLEKEKQKLEKKIKKTELENNEIKQEIKQYTKDNDKLKKEISQKQDLFAKQEASYEKKISELQLLASEYERLKANIFTKPSNKNSGFLFYDQIIDIDSLKTHKYGWKILYNEKSLSKIKVDDSYSIVGLVGRENIGKTFILNKLCDFELPSGTNVNTKGLSMKYSKSKHMICLDSAGIHTPVYYFNKKVQKRFSLSKNYKDNNDIALNEEIRHEMINDRTLTDLFVQDFILEVCELIIIVVGQLSQNDQKFIERIIGKYRFKKKIVIIHNFSNLYTVEDVEAKIQKDIKDAFQVKERYITGSDVFEYIEEIKKQDLENISHLVLAADWAESGKKFNKATFRYLNDILDTRNERKSFNLVNKLIEFFKENYRLYLRFNKKPSKVELVEEKDELRIEADQKYEISNPIFNVLGSLVTNPPYEVYELGNENLEKYLVFVDLPNLKSFETEINKKSQFNCLEITGLKNEVKIENVLKINDSRGSAIISCKIPLGDRNIQVKIDKKKTIYSEGVLKVEVKAILEEVQEI